MTLDIKKLLTKIKNLENKESTDDYSNRLDATYGLFKSAVREDELLLKKLIETKNASGANFYFGMPEIDKSEKLDTLHPCQDNFLQPHITIASDGSQINPSAHEFTSAFLINIGMVAIPYYKSSVQVLIGSEPTIYSSSEEINLSNTAERILEEDLVSYERTLKEIESLVQIAENYRQNNIPMIALVDGTLIHWHIEKFSGVYIEQFIKRFSDAISKLKSMNVVVACFLSNSRANDLINMLKVFKCPYETVNCKKYCANISYRDLPCNPTSNYKSVLDRRIIEKYFSEVNPETGTRTILFRSNSKILNCYPDDLKIYFFYINTGREIARVEIPAYIAKDKTLLDLLHNAISLQCKVGFGYPVTLSEAHLAAVVTKNDREIFYNLLKEQVLTKKQNKIKLSYKELKKRISFV